MTEHGTRSISPELKREAARRPHLAQHLKQFRRITGEFPKYVEEPESDHEVDHPNILYSVDGPIFSHIHGDVGRDTQYYAIEPTLNSEGKTLYDKIRDRLLDLSANKPAPSTNDEYDERIKELLEETVQVKSNGDGRSLNRLLDALGIGRTTVEEQTYENLRYQLTRDIAGYGPLEPVMRDPSNEDIHVVGPQQCYVDHDTFGLLETTVEWESEERYDNWLRNMGERIGDPLSDSDPIVDSTLPDGSRINIIYSDDVSVQGSSLTIRQGDEVPLSVLQITKWGTLSPELAAYLWLALENEQTIFVVGETASGKTTTLNAIMSFIPRDSKIYTAEDTLEVLPPHDNWQQLKTREGSGDDSADVDMFDLVEAALRSRPEYIIVGEVRGEEGRMAFQAAQTGHPVMLTFHASDIVSMIQRFTGDPINVPETFMDNADIALFQNRVKQGDDVLRRVTSVQEIEGYSEEMDGVVTRQSFYWDPARDEIIFQGRNNSYVLEEQIATLLGYEDTREIYDELDFRAEVIERMVEENILGYHEVNEAIETFQRDGIEGLPFGIAREY
ncbi:type II/IV secretion system ATPase subunit [Salinarchaeum sp. IM2453]|uniref:type II/IV secretion system ATPase subunit n=1 Tax=Salinarchaeum sp. IM2453 TaxID=2862870 RepID=UPI001C83EE63|nr:type II/IV secretion system ATPase subunit [Salinarchaeum sp. IM2453]QZA87455.1 type II/IV secretion system ATPase subunit [Salinarchaeum sp. IM2453]